MFPPSDAAVTAAPMVGPDPETLYVYSPTPELPEPLLQSSIPPQPSALDPEDRFQYSPPTLGPEPDLAQFIGGVPDLPVLDGFAGMSRLPGQRFRFISER